MNETWLVKHEKSNAVVLGTFEFTSFESALNFYNKQSASLIFFKWLGHYYTYPARILK